MSDTWIESYAWKMPMHVGHMESHVCEMHGTLESYKYGSSNSVRGGSSKEKEGEGKREREEKKRK